MSALLKYLFKAFNHLSQPKSHLISTLNKFEPHILNRLRFYSTETTPYEIVDNQEQKLTRALIKNVHQQCENSEQGRLFAVVHVAGKQFKITSGDLIIIEGYWPPDVGDKIKLDKVLLVGAKDFSLIGKPLVQDGLVDIYATVIEKGLSHTKTHFKMKRRKQYRRINFCRMERTMLRINEVKIVGEVNKPLEIVDLGCVRK